VIPSRKTGGRNQSAAMTATSMAAPLSTLAIT
jgi:hypothetical protein